MKPLAAVLLLLTPAFCQQPANSQFDPGIRPETESSLHAEQQAEDAWFAHVRYLAGDDLKGRRTGTPGFLQAAEYVESQWRSVGVKPAGRDGFRQQVGFRTVLIDNQRSSFTVRNGSGGVERLTPGTDLTLAPRPAAMVHVQASAVFAGYGLVLPKLGVNDLQGLDLHGKIAVIFASSPSTVHGPLKAYFRTLASRWKELKGAGAIGVIYITDQPQRGAARGSRGARPITQLSDSELDPLSGLELGATISASSADALFQGAAHGLSELRPLAEAGKPLPGFNLPITVEANTATQETARFEAPNLVGLLEGSDPRLKREYLVLSAHLDHLGEGQPVNGDNIYNGAMDNAAGIASLIETARALSGGSKPRRSILFLVFTGEEFGELGSQFFAHYPTVPRRQIIADLNMDMYLPLFPLRFLEVQGLGESTLGNDARAAAQRNDIEVQFDKQPDENRFIRSDQASFVKYGIPGLAFKFGWLPDTSEQKTFNDWIKNRYHHANDDIDQPIDRAAAVHFDRVLLTLARRVADASNRPAWYPESFFSTLSRF